MHAPGFRFGEMTASYKAIEKPSKLHALCGVINIVRKSNGL